LSGLGAVDPEPVCIFDDDPVTIGRDVPLGDLVAGADLSIVYDKIDEALRRMQGRGG
jgi:hypothetical protein